jgi:nucleoside triphosphate pyrophosphatase
MTVAPEIVLASQSPRRRELLALIGLAHEVRPADIDESPLSGEAPEQLCERLARGKASALAEKTRAGAVVIGSDTIVVVDDMVLGKPRDTADAARMLRLLSGRSHTVLTAVAVARKGSLESAVERVAVSFRAIDDAEIAAYIATREPMDKAGAYGIQGYGATIVSRIEGDYFAVMGLALNLLVRLLARVGLRYEFGRLVETAPIP